MRASLAAAKFVDTPESFFLPLSGKKRHDKLIKIEYPGDLTGSFLKSSRRCHDGVACMSTLLLL